MNTTSNQLIHASSPYLLQHANNPVQWQEWGNPALQQAKDENKLIIVSIGYSACHWCHVMEKESFEDVEVAEIMNKHFVCIKIDREERPDIDQVYMLAVQLMGLQGGWPLNCICLPDQRPIYGGTYFRKADWMNVLESIAEYWKNEPDQAIAYAEKLSRGIHAAERFVPNLEAPEFSEKHIVDILTPWKRTFDMVEGGYMRAPKFPLPNNWLFLLRAGFLMNDEACSTATLFALERMAMGGIYDQIGGGFSRYSVDEHWHVPHFEKMLYDNAQLISLYAEAWQFSGIEQFRTIADACIEWIDREMTSPEGLFYSAIDADSEGVEGKYYIWTADEVEKIAGDDAALVKDYFTISKAGNWPEMQSNILHRKFDDAEIANKYGYTESQWRKKITLINQKLLAARQQRVRPGLDDKCLTAWNGMTIKALAEASLQFSEPKYYHRATRAMSFILSHVATADGKLYRNFKNGKPSIDGFLDDYAFTISALIALYQVDFDEKWLRQALTFTHYALDYFSDADSPMLYYTSMHSDPLIARKHEVIDNVIPSSNSEMADNLSTLGLLYDNEAFTKKSQSMLEAIFDQMSKYGAGYSNWALQLLNRVFGKYEIAITGEEANEIKSEWMSHYIPNKVFLGGTKSTLPLLENKPISDLKIYICKNKVCSLPVSSVQEALKFISKQ